jgi:hypothetical protein
LRAYPTSACCYIHEDPVECVRRQHKAGKTHVGLRQAKDLEQMCLAPETDDQ